jgi:uncharacterized protein (TIGR02246 family)
MQLIAFLAAAVMLFGACSMGITQQSPREAIAGLVQSMQTTSAVLNADEFVRLLEQSPEFCLFSDGHVMTYEETAKEMRAFFGETRINRLMLDTLYIRVLSPDVVAAFTPFHQIITDTTGATAQFKGDALWIARRTDGQWKICYSQSNHLRDEVPPE